MIAGIEAKLARLEQQAAERTAAAMTPAEFAAEKKRTNWRKVARPSQLPPPGVWTYWTILAGRGNGKTRTGAEWTRHQAKTVDYCNLIGATADDARDVMITGESGILAVCPRWERPEYLASKRALRWPNGGTSLIFSADEPERLRGKQHGNLWCDELAAWRYPEAWDQAKFGLRLGMNPRALITTTPKPTKLIKALIADPAAVVTRGTTYENAANLAPAFLATIIRQYEGTRMGRQELNAEVLIDNPGALWQRDQIDALRVREHPPLTRIVVAVDPAVTSNADSDETGIIVAGVGTDGHGYVLADRSLLASPEGWGRAAVHAFEEFAADRIVAESNNGGDLVESLLRNIDQSIPYRKVTATRGKLIRAEPVAALYEQGRVHHVGAFEKLEDQLCEYSPQSGSRSPDRMDALVWALADLFSVASDGLLEFMRAEYERLGSAPKSAEEAATS